MVREWGDNKSVQREVLPRDEWQLAGNLLPGGRLPHMVHGIRAVID